MGIIAIYDNFLYTLPVTENYEELPLQGLSGLQRAFSKLSQPIELVGLHSAFSLALLHLQSEKSYTTAPQVVVFANEKECEKFHGALQYFSPHIRAFHLPGFDVGLYSGLYPNPKVVASRLRWLHRAGKAKPGELFTATMESLCQQTIPFNVFNEKCLSFKKGEDLPDNLHEILEKMGYHSVPTVEDFGAFAIRGGIFDIYSPAHKNPIRVELFGDQIDSIREFDADSQRSLEDREHFTIIPAKEALYRNSYLQETAQNFSKSCEKRNVPKEEVQEILRSIGQKTNFFGIDFLLPYFFEKLSSPIEYFNESPNIWLFNALDIYRAHDEKIGELKFEFDQSTDQVIRPKYTDIYQPFEEIPWPDKKRLIPIERIKIDESPDQEIDAIDFKSFSLDDFSKACQAAKGNAEQQVRFIQDKLGAWRAQGYRIFVSCHSQSSAQRLSLLLEKAAFETQVHNSELFEWQNLLDGQARYIKLIDLIVRPSPDSARLPDEHLIFLKDDDFWGKKRSERKQSGSEQFLEKAQALSFGDLKPGDFVVHKLHGIGVYDGLEVMNVGFGDSEFIRLHYKGNDKLFLPVYRIGQLQKYSGPSSETLIDKLGGNSWAKTTTKVKKQVRDIAANLLKLYAKRSQSKKDPFPAPDEDFERFENSFPYTETEDQQRAIDDVLSDMQTDKPMDRLVCGDVGFGKTEVALRAAFKAVQAGKQVALVAPTTILTFQHTETFKKRFKDWPVEIRTLNRFIPTKKAKETLKDLKENKVDIVIGTHRLLSKDVKFGNLGLLILDEEQKFGVAHKEKIREMKESVDTMALSATPIPRTLNMSLMGLRDLSIINTPPEDRLPTRTFVCKFDEQTIKKAIESEVRRGGQVFFLHNRINSIYELTDRLRNLLPDMRIAIGHGQMPEETLEKTMVKFFNHEVDVLVCTAIIESGMDIPKANTIFIDNAQQLGVSQLYQLRGRVGRSKERAYCYLVIPPNKKLDKDAQERIRIIQENTALGSGIKVAHYDLELRGAGDLLGAEQSGHINAVGYEMYLELLEEAVREQKGEPEKAQAIDPEINLRTPAFIPDKYIPDVRMRLSYYKALSQIERTEQLDTIEDELRDQFGAPPDEVLNLMGLMLIRKQCRDLGIKDCSAGKNWLTLTFSEQTPLPVEEVIRLTAMENKKYAITPDQRLKIRMSEVTWPRVHDELTLLLRLCPRTLNSTHQIN